MLLKDRVRSALERVGAKQADLAAYVGISRSSVSDWLDGSTKSLEGRNLLLAAKFLQVSPEWLANGNSPLPTLARPGQGRYEEGSMTTGAHEVRDVQPGVVFNDVSERPARRSVTALPVLAWEHAEELPSADYVLVPRLDAHLAAGHGTEEQPQLELTFIKEQPQAFRADWIRRRRLRPNKLAVMYAAGNSMEPRIHDGDALLVDTSDTAVRDGGVYALWYEGGERVKRLYRRPSGGLIVRSDNNQAGFPDFTLSAEEAGAVRIIGRVVLISGGGGL